MNALRGTGVEPDVVLLLEEPPPPELLEVDADVPRELDPDVLAVLEADEPAEPDNTLVPFELVRAEVWVLETLDEPPTERFITPWTAVNEDPLLLVAGVSSAFPDEVVPPAPAPEEEPAVLDATVVVVPFWVACI